VIVAPFGDDPVLLSQVTISNRSKSVAELRWVEYWGCQVYQFSFRSFMEQFAGGSILDVRHKLGDRFTHKLEPLDSNAGLLEMKQFLGRTPQEETLWQRMNGNLKAHPNAFLTAQQDSVPEASFDDLNPPSTFLVSLDSAASAVTTNAAKFFGAGGVSNPTGLSHPLDGDLTASGTESGLLLERAFELKPGEQRTLYFLYGYLPGGVELKPLVSKYRANAASVW